MPRDTELPQTPSADLADAIARGASALAARQNPDGHFVYELEADATIPAEYVLLEHYLDRIEPALEAKIGVYLRAIQGDHGGWPLFHDGGFDLSASVKAYFALKAIGDAPEAPHMARARAAILAAGGAARAMWAVLETPSPRITASPSTSTLCTVARVPSANRPR
jgi:squalene-hopene/tetraprenyl-beta-curcumene cyclase